MGRSRSFDEGTVLDQAAAAFLATGFEGTSIDDLVRSTGLQRGSLYQAFGSKRGMFVAALDRVIATVPEGTSLGDEGNVEAALDLLLVAALELAPRDAEVRGRVANAIAHLDDPSHTLGHRLLQRAHLTL